MIKPWDAVQALRLPLRPKAENAGIDSRRWSLAICR